MAELTVFSTIGVRSAAEPLFAQFDKASGHTLAVTWGTAPMLVKRIEDGDSADVVVLSRAGIEALQKLGKLAAGSDVTLAFSAVATAGSVNWILESGCSNANDDISAVKFGAPVTLTAKVSAAPLGLVTTATLADFAVPGTNGCAAGTAGVGSLITVRLHRSADSAAGDAHLLGAIVTSKRSQ